MKKPEAIIKQLKRQQPGVEWLPINEVIENPGNPRKITESNFEDLKESIKTFPAMMVLRPGVIDLSNVLQGNNQRHKACVALGWPEFPVIRANGLTPEQLQEFMIKDNMSSGNWDKEMLSLDWDMEDLKNWNFDMEMFEVEETEMTQVSNPPANNMKHMKTITLKFTEKDHALVKEKLQAIADTPEHAVWILLKLKKTIQN